MKKTYRIICLLFLSLGALLAGGLYYISPILKPFPPLTGSYDVGIQTVQWTDQKRAETYSHNPDNKRSLMVHIWYPTEKPVPETEKYPYLGSKMPIFQKAIADHYGIPAWAGRLLLRNITTHAYQNAPLSQSKTTYPVILFSHGLLGGMPSDMYGTILENLASNGYIVINIDHPYFSGLTLFPDGNIASSHELNAQFQKMSPDEQKEFQNKAIDVYKADMKFVLDQIILLNQDPHSILYHRLDLDRIGVMGHSAGGTASIEFCRTETRCKAAIDLDGWYDQAIGHEPITQPLLLLFGAKSIEISEPTPGYLARKQITREQYYERERMIEEHKKELCKSPLCSMIIIPDASHEDFGDAVLFKWPLRAWNAADSYKTIAMINENILKFFDIRLKL